MLTYEQAKAALIHERESTQYFTRAFLRTWQESQAFIKRAMLEGKDFERAYDKVKKTDFYNKNGCAYCVFLSIAYSDEKEDARQEAIEWQRDFENQNYSWDDIAKWGSYFAQLGKWFDLLREFEENGIC